MQAIIICIKADYQTEPSIDLPKNNELINKFNVLLAENASQITRTLLISILP
jgi:hypothetical protein